MPPQLPPCKNCETFVFSGVGKYFNGTIPALLRYGGWGFIDYFGNFTYEPDVDVSSDEYAFNVLLNAISGLYLVEFPGEIQGYVDIQGDVVYKP